MLFFNRLVVLFKQLTCTFRRLAGDVLHRHALPEIGLVVRRRELGGDLQILLLFERQFIQFQNDFIHDISTIMEEGRRCGQAKDI